MHANEPLGLDPPETRLCFYARSLLKSSVVQAVLVANLRSPTSKDVVFVKENTLELLACAGESEPVSICELSLFGCVKCCQRVSHNAAFPFVETAHPPLAGCDLLVILSSSGKLSFVGVKQNRWSAPRTRSLPLADRMGGDATSCDSLRHKSARQLPCDSLL
jgi:hypothetical protein